MSPRQLLLAISTVLALCACGKGGKLPEVDDRELLASAFDRLRLDRAPQPGPDPANFDPALLGPDMAGRGSPYVNDVSFNAVVRGLGGRSFCFVSRFTGPDSTHSLSWLEIGSGKPATPVAVGIAPPVDGYDLALGIQPVPGGLLVVYPYGTRVVEVRASLAEEGLSFAPPRAIFTAPKPILGLQLTPTDDRLHLIWTTLDQLADSSLHYSGAATSDLGWGEPRLLSDTVGYGQACMAAGDRDLYVAWSDFRYRKRHWDYYTNSGKVFVTGSRDGGKTFLTPVSLHAPKDESAVGGPVDMAVGRGGLAVFWQLDTTSPDPQYTVWGRAAVDFDLRRMIRGSSFYKHKHGGGVERPGT
jgi:hypothetical protein